MKKTISILMIVFALLTLTFCKINREEGSNVLLEVFNQTDFETVGANINTYAVLDKPIKNFEDMEEYIENLDKIIITDYEYKFIKEESSASKIVKKVYISENTKLTVKLETTFSEATSTTIVMDVMIYNSCDEITPIKERVCALYKTLELVPKINISITGLYAGSMDYNQKKITAIDIMKKIDAKSREDYITDTVYSMVGYTNKISEYIYSSEQKININLALRYNSYEDKTYLYLATPVITVEY